MEKAYRWGANTIFWAHIAIGLFFLTGWMLRDIRFIYLPLLISWPLSWVVFGYCPFTKWELMLEKKIDSSVNTDAEFIQYNVQKYLGVRIPSRPIYIGGLLVFFVLLAISVMQTFVPY